MEKENFFKCFERKIGINTKIEKIWFWICFCLLILYLEGITIVQNIYYDKNIFITIFCAIGVVLLSFVGIFICSKVEFKINKKDSKKKNIILSISVFCITLLFYLLWQWAYFPGSFSPDSLSQLEQVITGNYNNWHPVLHTWIFFFIPYMIFNNVAAIVTMQIILFSLTVTYLCYVLYKYGLSKVIIFFAWLYIILNPNTSYIMLYPWKDSAFSIFSLILFVQLIQIYMTKGLWLKKWYNNIAFTIVAFLALEMRHNAILLIFPIFIILCLTFKKEIIKSLAISVFSIIIAMLILHGMIFKLADVKLPDKRVLETVGMPMTVISNVYVNDKNELSNECKEFMDSLATQEQWENNFNSKLGFNSIKWAGNSNLGDKVDAEGYKNIFRYLLEAFINSPKYAVKGFFELTRMVWGTCGDANWKIPYGISDNNYNIQYYNGNELLSKITAFYGNNKLVLKIFNYLGTIICIMMFAAIGKIGKGNLSKIFIIVPPLIYNFGTMLLLTGNDFRFFHLNFLIIIPILYIIFVNNEEKDKKTS